MKLKDGFEVVTVGEKSVLVPTDNTGFKGVVNMNRTAGFILSCLQKETTREAVLDEMKKKYSAPEETLSTALDRVLDTLKTIRALDE